VSERLIAYYAEELPRRALQAPPPERIAHRDQFIAACLDRGLRRVLEVGCGAARDGVALHAGDLMYTGVDLSPVGVELCRAQGLDAEVASATALPFADSSFDCAWTMSTLMHLEGSQMDVAVRELSRVVRRGGLLEVGIWGATSAGTRVDEHGRFFQQRTDEQVRAMLEAVGTIEAFEAWDWYDDGGHYQWARVTIA
jgi:SAM-dependent methyltransferase